MVPVFPHAETKKITIMIAHKKRKNLRFLNFSLQCQGSLSFEITVCP
jgi:hypothetical protein